MNTEKLQTHGRDEAGFTLIELLIVMSIIIVIATFAIANLGKIKRQGNETSAIQSIHAIIQAQLMYSQTYPANGFSCSLQALGGQPGGTPGPEAAGLLQDDLASGHKAGYTFAITNCSKTTINNQDHINSYEITAVPDQVGKTGDRGFCSSEDRDIKYDVKGGTNCTAPIQ